MKKEQKRLGNKGFSLVELIVVIAIMAILVAVLAPTLLSKIEDSREGTDLQALGEINTAIKEAILSSETVNDDMPAGVYTIDASTREVKDSSGTVIDSATTQFKRAIPEIDFKSDKAESAIIRVTIGANGTVQTELVEAASDTAAIKMSNDESFIAK